MHTIKLQKRNSVDPLKRIYVVPTSIIRLRGNIRLSMEIYSIVRLDMCLPLLPENNITYKSYSFR